MAKIYGDGHIFVPKLGGLVSFIDGVIETDDQDVVKLAKISGFQVDEPEPIIEPEKPKRLKKEIE